MGAPYSVTEDFIRKYRISAVVHGSAQVLPDVDGRDPYEAARKLALLHPFQSEFPDLTSGRIVERIISMREHYAERNRKKEAKEIAMLKRMKDGEQ